MDYFESSTSPTRSFLASATLAALASIAHAQSPSPEVFSAPGHVAGAKAPDYAAAVPKSLPLNATYSKLTLKQDYAAALEGNGSPLGATSTRSNPGTGKRVNSLKLPAPKADASQPEDSGTANLPFSTARADLDPTPTNTEWPYRAAGKLFFVEDKKDYVCSASLIDRGLVITAAHCVSAFGKNQIYSEWKFVPGYRTPPGKQAFEAPFGVWTARKAYMLAGYPAGTAPCDQGVVCRDDVALLVLQPQPDENKKPYMVGDRTGWFAYVSGPQPFASGGLTHVTQLGYPVCLDNGQIMERNDAQGTTSSSNRDNTVAGSLMCGGSSGGPWIVNFGVAPQMTATIPGKFSMPNVIVGVTSWGSTDNSVKQMGASPLLTSNIDFLVKAACQEFPDACRP